MKYYSFKTNLIHINQVAVFLKNVIKIEIVNFYHVFSVESLN